MTGDRSRRAASSTSRRRRSGSSRRSAEASSGSTSSGERAPGEGVGDGGLGSGGLGAGAIRELARRHGVRPTKALGQNFLIDPNLARAIAADAEVGPGDRVVEIGAGFGSLTIALAETGAEVVAVEFDRALLGALAEVVRDHPRVRIVHADALRLDWEELLGDGGRGDGWVLCANLPYNIATPLVLDLLAGVPRVVRAVVTVQREVGERLAAGPGGAAYGAPSVRVAARATAAIVRKVPPTVFWPRPAVDSVVVRIDRHARPAVDPEDPALWRVVDAGFAERRKTMRNALRRLGIDGVEAETMLGRGGLSPNVRAEELSLADFAALAAQLPPAGPPATEGGA